VDSPEDQPGPVPAGTGVFWGVFGNGVGRSTVDGVGIMKPLSILYLEDNPIDVELIHSRLEAEGIAHRLIHSATAKQFMHALEARSYDIVLMDYSVPGFEKLTALKMTRERLPDVPVIIISGVIGEEIAIEMLKQGAIDYVLKQRISRLAPAIRRALQETQEHLRRKAAEKALKESEEHYRTIFSNTGTATVIIDDKAIICLANDEFKKLAGTAAKVTEGKSRFTDFVDGEDQRKLSAFLADHLKDKTSAPRRSEFHFIDAKGGRKNIILTISGIPGTLKSVVSLLDSTELKKKQHELKEAEEKYRMLFETSPEAIILCDLEGRIQACNPQGARLIGIPSDKAVGQPFLKAANASSYDLSPLQGLLSGVLKGSDKRALETQIGVNGETRWINVIPTFLKENKKPYALQLIIREITERKMAEDRIQKDLKEKEVLLKEIHHRVKNNLQLMCSLLHLQSASFRDDSSRKRCEACRDRIYAMSLVHEHLYLSRNLSSINFSESAQSLIHKLIDSHEVRGRVSVHLEMKDVSLPIGISIPLALIVNELVANALQHAFPEGRKGQIRLLLHPAARNSFEFVVMDDGIGLPNSIDMENTKGFGLHLVSMLVRQIDGTVVINRKKGTSFKILFPFEAI
jgi:PAS domain S-box-containing protein